ncbi:unnamed protein product [marine sediment metagenome]|uniref:Uncharacterized protein n=1 Tax=marine sediment metagenome TaxID=412755 RepID=X1B880_9ZZZZ
MKVAKPFKNKIEKTKLCPAVLLSREPQECIKESCYFWIDEKCQLKVIKQDFKYKKA